MINYIIIFLYNEKVIIYTIFSKAKLLIILVKLIMKLI